MDDYTDHDYPNRVEREYAPYVDPSGVWVPGRIETTWKPGAPEYIAEQNAQALDALTATLEAVKAGTQTLSQADLNTIFTRVALICIASVRGDQSTTY